jgi:predicted kinase
MSNLTLYLIRGLPGAGKTTLAKELAEVIHPSKHYEADEFFVNEDGVYEFDPSKLHDAHKCCQFVAETSLRAGLNAIISNTSTTEKEAKVYQDIAEKYNARFISLIVENRHDGVNIHGVPEEKLQQMRNRFTTKL